MKLFQGFKMMNEYIARLVEGRSCFKGLNDKYVPSLLLLLSGFDPKSTSVSHFPKLIPVHAAA